MDIIKKIIKEIGKLGPNKKHKHKHKHKREKRPKTTGDMLKEMLDKEKDADKRDELLDKILSSIQNEVDKKGGIYGMDGDDVAAIMSYYLEDDDRYKKLMGKMHKHSGGH